jgi:hypothetical protein
MLEPDCPHVLAQECDRVVSLLYRALDPVQFSWRTLHKALLVLHHLLRFGSDRAVSSIMEFTIKFESLKNYNSVLANR